MKLQQLNNGAFILALPSQIIRAKQWAKGDEIKIIIDTNGDLILKEKK